MVSCTEFIPLYSELFKWLEKRNGKEEVIKYWSYVSDNYVEPLLGTPVKEHGIQGCYEYWSKSLNEEACDFTMTYDDEEQSFDIDMHKCPSRGMLNQLTYTNPYHNYCGHCGILYSKVICDKYGYKYEFDFSKVNKASCYEIYYEDKEKLGTGTKIYCYDTMKSIKKVIPDRVKILEFMDNISINTPKGRYDFGDEGYINVVETTTSNANEIFFESHKDYYDIQCMIKGEERVLYGKITEMKPTCEYNKEDDYILYKADNYQKVDYKTGEFIVIDNSVGHCPCRAVDNGVAIKKAIIKVKI